MAINKVTFGGTTLIDLSADTVTADKLAAGTTAHGCSGTAITGTAEITYDAEQERLIMPEGFCEVED